jgi:hypothetical protein
VSDDGRRQPDIRARFSEIGEQHDRVLRIAIVVCGDGGGDPTRLPHALRMRRDEAVTTAVIDAANLAALDDLVATGDRRELR